MIWFIALGMAVIAVTAYLKPDWFKHAWETTVLWVYVGASPFLVELFSYFLTDTSWAEVLPDQHKPWAYVVVAVLGIFIRHMNVEKPKKS